MATMELSRRFYAGLPAFGANTLTSGKRHISSTEECFRIGLLVPMCGAAGLWGPSCIASAQVAIAELNLENGILGQQVELVLVDAAFEADGDLYQTIHEMIEFGEIDAIVGMHISAVRQQLAKVVRGRVPYVYTPLYEGGEESPGVYAIGETPDDQLVPAIRSIASLHKIKNWALIGNDYVWPRASNYFAKQCIQSLGGKVIYEQYVPFGVDRTERLIDDLEASGAEAILLSFIGQDAVDFNRAFGSLALDKQIIRLSCAIEENGLLAIGEKNSKRLYSSSSYFSTLNTPSNIYFKEKYYGQHGDRAPALNALGQSSYEGVQFLAELMKKRLFNPSTSPKNTISAINYRSARDATYFNNKSKNLPIYLARADGFKFSILEKL
ncbi:MAG: substrate-binding domain-containing protein [Sneathiella sp.]|uniref:substrate-binding domain-containing protein n=1 Tax=Sneathiella sp. TaxID=1964365 RepID=UPI0030019444